MMPEVKAYHGSRNGHQGFDTGHTGDNSHTFGSYQSKRSGIFFTKNPKFAALYGDVQEYTLKLRKTCNLDAQDNFLYNFAQSLYEQDRNLWLDASSIVDGHSSIWMLFENELGEVFVKYLKSNGFDSAVFTEYNQDDNEKEIKSKTYVVFNPANVIKNGQLSLNLWESMRHWINVCG